MDRRLFLAALGANVLTGIALLVASVREKKASPSGPALVFRKADDSGYVLDSEPGFVPSAAVTCRHCGGQVPLSGDVFHAVWRNESNTGYVIGICRSPRRQA
jgi:hypothetical protein